MLHIGSNDALLHLVQSCARISCARLHFPNPVRFRSTSAFQKAYTALLLTRELVIYLNTVYIATN
jgi:hypothetical protein